jgi:hypothetical protein
VVSFAIASVQGLLFSGLLSTHVKIIGYMYRTLLLPVILYECETSFFAVREERKAMLFENRVLRRIFRLKRGEVTGS